MIIDPSLDRFPVYSRDGEWVTSRRGSWTGGYWVGLLWLRAKLTGEGHDVAREWTERLLPRADDDTVTRGMTFWYGAAAGHLLCGDERAAEIARHGARALAQAFDRELGLIPLGTAFGPGLRTSVDAVAATVQLLRWAGHTDEAERHLARHVELCVLPRTPELVWHNGNFHAEEPPGVWSRGLAWSLLAHPDPGLVQHWLAADFPPPDRDNGLVDTSAAAIAAYALRKLGHDVDHLVRALEAHVDERGVLLDGAYRTTPGRTEQVGTIWGTFFLDLLRSGVTLL